MEKLKCCSGSTLKIIAIVIMTIDHVAAGLLFFMLHNVAFFPIEQWVFWDNIYVVLRQVGRTAFPLFCFLLVEGFLHTKSREKYAISLLAFSFLSEIPFDYMLYHGWDMGHQNVFFTLLIGLLVIWGMNWCEIKFKYTPGALCLQVVCVMAGCVMAFLLKTDYSYHGILLIAIFYYLREYRLVAGIAGYLCMLFEPWCFPAFILIQLYNGKRGVKLKYFFYFYYPVHLLIIYGLWTLTKLR